MSQRDINTGDEEGRRQQVSGKRRGANRAVNIRSEQGRGRGRGRGAGRGFGTSITASEGRADSVGGDNEREASSAYSQRTTRRTEESFTLSNSKSISQIETNTDKTVSQQLTGLSISHSPGSRNINISESDEQKDNNDETKNENENTNTISLRNEDDKNLPLRPDYGKSGEKITLHANHFQIALPSNLTFISPTANTTKTNINTNSNTGLFEYAIQITPEIKSRWMRKRLFDLLEDMEEYKRFKGIVAHDYAGKLVACKRLSMESESESESELGLRFEVLFKDEDENEAGGAGGGGGKKGQKGKGKGKAKGKGKEKEKEKEKEKKYTIEINFIQELNFSDLTKYLQHDPTKQSYDFHGLTSAINLILSQHASRTGVALKLTQNSKNKHKHDSNKFFFSEFKKSLGGGLDVWKGFFSSVRPARGTLMVNINVAAAAFYKEGNLAERYAEWERATNGASVDAFVNGVRVRLTHLRYKKTVVKAARYNARQYKFYYDEVGREVSCEEYFNLKYEKKLQHPELPLIDFTPRNSSRSKRTYVPAELCEILPGQMFRGELTKFHQSEMIKYASRPPSENRGSILTVGLNSLGFNPNNASETLQAFGIGISSQMTIVPGRILSLPSVVYREGNPKDVDKEKASWNLRDVKFKQGATLEINWAVLVIKDGNAHEFSGADDLRMKECVKGFMQMCKKSGMRIISEIPAKYTDVQLPPYNKQDPMRRAAINAIQIKINDIVPKPVFLFVLLFNTDSHIYDGIKYICDVILDIHTICAISDKIGNKKGQQSFFANEALKLNMKLGGINHVLGDESMRWLLEKDESVYVKSNSEGVERKGKGKGKEEDRLEVGGTMLVGMDVTHPGFESTKGTPSIAAVVANVDDTFAQFPASLAIQESKKEMVTNLKDLMVERLLLYKSKSKRLPGRILVYRDGVSEGQFNTVIREEMPLIKDAFRKFGDYKPKLTIVICGKRHHTRFYPTERAFGDRNGNPKPGTVVDQTITAIYEFDFFLQAHAGLQGTTKPTHYYVVHDEIGFTADSLQKLTNDISYLFGRATKGVSLASPAYYADLACERGRCYLHQLLNSKSSGSEKSEDDIRNEAEKLWQSGVNGPVLKDTMYYL